jgi:hypothetical protein
MCIEKFKNASSVFVVILGLIVKGISGSEDNTYKVRVHTNYEVVSFLQLFLHMTFCVCNLWHRIP